MSARFLFLVLALVAAALPAEAQEGFARVTVRVTGLAGDEVYLDQGSDAGLASGDTVELDGVAGGVPLLGVIRSVSRRSSRASIRGPIVGLGAGASGVVLVPEARLADAAKRGETPEHPPWTHAPLEWEDDVPLLAPVSSRTPEERDIDVRGRVYGRVDYTDDTRFDQQFTSGDVGLEVDVENPFGHGNSLGIEVEGYGQYADLDESDDDSDTRLRIDRASYRRDVLRGRPTGWEVGRFLHSEFAELGLIDGAEVVHRTEGGDRFGASLGILPLPDDTLSDDGDVSASVFYRFVAGEDERFSLGTAYQKTWHDGNADRDLVIATLDAYPSRAVSLYGTAWIDYYTSGDDPKSKGFQLTQLQAGANWRAQSGFGVGVFGSHLRWPELRRDEYDDVIRDTIDDGKVSRIGVNTRIPTSENTRLDGRVDYWKDQDEDGGSASMRYTLRDVLYDRGEVGFEVYGSDAQYTDSIGGRLTASRRFDTGYARILWDLTDFDPDEGDLSNLDQHYLRASYDVSLGQDWDLSLYAEARFGEKQESTGAGIYLQRRF